MTDTLTEPSSWLADYKAFAADREPAPTAKVGVRLDLLSAPYLVDPKTGNIRINTARVQLARHSRGLRRSEASKLLGIVLREMRTMERRNYPLFLPRENAERLAAVLGYPLRFFTTFETGELDDDPACLERQIADWERRDSVVRWSLYVDTPPPRN